MSKQNFREANTTWLFMYCNREIEYEEHNRAGRDVDMHDLALTEYQGVFHLLKTQSSIVSLIFSLDPLLELEKTETCPLILWYQVKMEEGSTAGTLFANDGLTYWSYYQLIVIWTINP